MKELKTVVDTIKEPQAKLYYSKGKTNKVFDKPIKVISLFSGCGGMDLGFEGGFAVNKHCLNINTNPDFIDVKINDKYVKVKSTKFQTVFANDILKEARKSWVKYFSKRGYHEEVYHLDSIVDLVKFHKQGINIFPEDAEVVIGGFPCQDFSVSGKRKGFNSHKDHNGKYIDYKNPSVETRGQLYMWMKEVIDIVNPKVFIAENVKGLVNLSNVKDIIQNDFASANGNGYIVLPPQVLHAADYGVPQSRERVFFIGIKKSELNVEAIKELEKENISDTYSPYPKPSHGNNHVKLKHVLEKLEEPDDTTDPSHMHFSKAKYMGKHCQGQTEISLEKIGPTIRAEHHGNIEYRRLFEENGGKNKKELNMGLLQRRLTPRECALIQTFPPDYEFVIPGEGKKFFLSPSSAYKLIGNAVPPLLAYHIAMKLEKVWNLYFKQK